MTQPPEVPPPGGWPAPSGWVPPPATTPSAPKQQPTTPPSGGPGLNLPPGWGGPPATSSKPGVIPLRPLGVDDFFTGIFSTFRRHWQPIVAIACLVTAAMTLLALPAVLNGSDLARAFIEIALFDSESSSAEAEEALRQLVDELVAFLPWILYASFLGLLAVSFIDAGVGWVVSRAVLGKATSPGQALQQLARRAGGLAILGLLIGASVTVGYVLCFLPGVALALMLFAAPTVLMVEGTSSLTAFKRSLQLSSRSFWRVIGMLLLIQLVYGFALQVFSVPFTFLTGFGTFGSFATGESSSVSTTAVVLGYLGLWVVGVLFSPFVSVAKSLLYIDLRMRQENLGPTLERATHG